MPAGEGGLASPLTEGLWMSFFFLMDASHTNGVLGGDFFGRDGRKNGLVESLPEISSSPRKLKYSQG